MTMTIMVIQICWLTSSSPQPSPWETRSWRSGSCPSEKTSASMVRQGEGKGRPKTENRGGSHLGFEAANHVSLPACPATKSARKFPGAAKFQRSESFLSIRHPATHLHDLCLLGKLLRDRKFNGHTSIGPQSTKD